VFDVEVFWDPLPSREEPASVEPDSVVACDDRRKVCVAPFARRDLGNCENAFETPRGSRDQKSRSSAMLLIQADVIQ
jgi:hypothetical protein